jgi:predicted nucleic acid-binding protein
MTGKYFLDTNFLVYCFSEDEPEKQAACFRILQEGQGKAHFVLSTQVLAEFAAVMIGKFRACSDLLRQSLRSCGL